MVKCAVIGCGVIAPTHIEGIAAIPGAELVALCDIKQDRLDKLVEKYGVARYSTDYRDILADPEVDLVHVCTDHASHAQIVIDALNAGKHVICEKSAGRVPEDLEAMSAAAKDHPELVSSGIFQHRFVKQNQTFRQMVADEKFGRGLMVNLTFCCLRTAEYYRNDEWRGTFAGEGGGLLINQAIHHLDQLRFVFGDVKAVSAICANQTHQDVIEVEDAAMFTIEFESGLIGSVCAINSSVTTWRHTLTYAGTKATLEYTNEVPVFVDSPDEALKAEITEALAPEKDVKVVGKAYYGSGHTAQIFDVCEAIEAKRAPMVSLTDAINSSSLVMAVYESARNGGARVLVKKY